MFHNLDDKSNDFEFVDIPSNRKLFEQMGFSRDESHPDGQDADTFEVPENFVGEYKSVVAREVIESDMRSHSSGKEVVESMEDVNNVNNDEK